MMDVFQILPSDKVSVLETKIQAVHDCQATADHLIAQLVVTPQDTALLEEQVNASAALQTSTEDLQRTPVTTSNLIKSFKDVDEATIRRSNQYYANYGAAWLVENLAWSSDMILNTCKDSLKDKVQEGLVGVSEMELGGLLALKKMLSIVMNVDGVA